MSLTLIQGKPNFTKAIPSEPHLYIAEFYGDTIQGENHVGWPSAFLRLQGCTLRCHWCDTAEVWRYGNPYSFTEVFDLIEKSGLLIKLKQGQHLVLTGGSPLMQQGMLIKFLEAFTVTFGFTPYIEIENECTLLPNRKLVQFISCWNNSPKLGSSGNDLKRRYHPNILKALSLFENSWFKFVIVTPEDWIEIEFHFLNPGLIKRSQIVLMPEGGNKEAIERNRLGVIELAIKHSVRYTTREHILVWNKLQGV